MMMARYGKPNIRVVRARDMDAFPQLANEICMTLPGLGGGTARLSQHNFMLGLERPAIYGHHL
jgi:hypothetical protein